MDLFVPCLILRRCIFVRGVSDRKERATARKKVRLETQRSSPRQSRRCDLPRNGCIVNESVDLVCNVRGNVCIV